MPDKKLINLPCEYTQMNRPVPDNTSLRLSNPLEYKLGSGDGKSRDFFMPLTAVANHRAGLANLASKRRR